MITIRRECRTPGLPYTARTDDGVARRVNFGGAVRVCDDGWLYDTPTVKMAQELVAESRPSEPVRIIEDGDEDEHD